MNASSYQLTVNELFHPAINGKDINSSPDILQHYIVIYCYSFRDLNDGETTDEDDSDEDEDDNNENDSQDNNQQYVIQLIDLIYDDIKQISHRIPTRHPTIRNYFNIRKRGLKPDIAQNIILSGGEKVSIIKTIWIRIIQRTWKRVYRAYLWGRYLRVLRGGARLELDREPRLLRGLLSDLLCRRRPRI